MHTALLPRMAMREMAGSQITKALPGPLLYSSGYMPFISAIREQKILR